MISNHARVGRALYLLKIELDSFIPREFLGYHQDQAATVLNQILGQSRDPQKPFHNMKAQDLLTVMQAAWPDVFERALTGVDPAMVREVAFAHEAWANRHAFSGDAAFQTLTTIQKLLSAMSSPSTLELEMLKVESLESVVEVPDSEVSQVVDSPERPEQQPPQEPPQADSPEIAEEEVANSVAGAAPASQPSDAAEPYLAELVQALREKGALQEQDYLAQSTRPGTQPEYADPSFLGELTPSLAQALGSLGPERLLTYQGQALAESLSGANVALESSWAADESMTCALTLAETLLRNPGSHALVVCPSAQAAHRAYAGMEGLLDPVGLRAHSWVDGASAPEWSPSVESSSPVLVTTPEILNRHILGDLANWNGWLSGLEFVAIEQAQEFRGFFGANVAVLLRRLAHALAVSGTIPRFFLTGHGCANATELAENLTGKSFQGVAAPAGPATKHHCLFIDPREPDVPVRAALSGRISRAALACVESGKSVLVYGASDMVTRDCYETFVSLCDGLDADTQAVLRVKDDAPGGDMGEALEAPAALSPTALFTSNPPSAGQTGRGFDGVILAGFPENLGTARALLETAGGAGREEGFLLFYAATSADDAFFTRNLEAFLEKHPDQVVFDADHADVVLPHLASLGQESGGRVYSFSRDVLGNAIFQLLRRQAAELSDDEELPPSEANLGTPGDQNWRLQFEEATVAQFGPYRKFREAYPGAIINVGGVKYRYLGADEGPMDDSPPVILVESSEGIANLLTEPFFDKSLEVREESLCLSLATGVSLSLGDVALEEQLTRIRAFDDSSLSDPGDEGQAGLEVTYTPEEEVAWRSVTPAFWIDVSGLVGEDTHGQDGEGGQAATSAMAALEQMFRLGARFTFPVGPYDLSTHCEGSRVFLVEMTREAQGVAKKAFDLWREILISGANIARQCPCEQGCTFCIVPPIPTGGDLDKARGLELADRLLEVTHVS